jgi:hypothetical protein
MSQHAGAAALARYREDTDRLPEVATFDDVYDLALQQVWRILKNHSTTAAVRQKYHLAILRLGKPRSSQEKTDALASLVALSKGKDGGQPHAVAEDAQDPDEE